MIGKPATASHSVAFWAVIIAAANIVHLWLFFHLSNAGPVQFWFTIALQVIATIGPFWMLADWFVKRRNKLRWHRWMWLFFVPWGFLWYIFEKWEPALSDLDRFSQRGA